MRKTFQLTAANKKPERQVESIKSEIKKYLARERRKKLPDDANFWDFDCKIGPSEEDNSVIRVAEVRDHIDKLASSDNQSFYLEILAKPGHKVVIRPDPAPEVQEEKFDNEKNETKS
jgi:hypothetical protein